MKKKKRNRIIVIILVALLIFNIISINCFAADYNGYYIIGFFDVQYTDKVSINIDLLDEVIINNMHFYDLDYISIYKTSQSTQIVIRIFKYVDGENNTDLTFYNQDVYIYKDDNEPVFIDAYYNNIPYSDIYGEDLYISLNECSILRYQNNQCVLFYNETINETTSSESTSVSTSESISDVSGSPIPTEILNIDQATMTFMNNTTGIYITLGCILLLVACAIVLSLIRRE